MHVGGSIVWPALAMWIWFAASASATTDSPTIRLDNFELRDQHNRPHRVAFPQSDVSVLVVADEQGAKRLPPWFSALKERLGDSIAVRGIAELSLVPRFMRASVRQRLGKDYPGPVLLDWSGSVASLLGCSPGEANVFVLATNGVVRCRWRGDCDTTKLQSLLDCIEANRTQKPAPDTERKRSPNPGR